MARGQERKKPMKVKVDLTSGSILLKLLVVAVPMLLTSLVQMAYNLTDLFWLSRVALIGGNHDEAVAAVGTAGYVPWFGFGLILIARIGVSVRVSQAAGRNDAERVNAMATNGLVLMTGLGLLYVLAGTLLATPYYNLFNLTNPNVQAEGVRYLRIVSAFGLSFFLVNLFNGVYDGLGKTINAFYITASGLVLNMILDPLLILGLGMGVTGAALATGISQTVVLLIYVALYLSKHRPARLKLKQYVNRTDLKNIAFLGFPVGLQSMLMTSIAIALGIMVAEYGETVIAVSRIGSQIEALSWMVASGFQVALAAFVGQNVGAGQFARVRTGYRLSMMLLVPYGILVNLSLFFGARPLFSAFISTEPTLGQGIDYLRILSLSQLFMILDMVTAGAFNGLGKTTIPSAIQMFGNALRIPLAIGLGAVLIVPYHGIWWALTISSIFKGVVLVILFAIVIRRILRKLETTGLEKATPIAYN
ncbi:MAG: MATE family efflux transporter [Acholeplasmatales bacterium]|nr:MAG: MATE family efflux transporter [Acholeplasmatales bacterium]